MDQIRIDTPESVDLALEPAGLGSRFLAALIDSLIQSVVIFLLFLVGIPAMALTMSGDEDPTSVGIAVIAILFLVAGLLFFLYKLLLEAFWNGQTIGKRAAGIRVVQANGMPVGFLQVVIRNLLRDLAAARGYWERRWSLEGEARARVAAQVAQSLAVRMGWQEELPPYPDEFIEEVLYVRAR